MKVGERGQVTIPKAIRDEMGIQKNSDVDFVLNNGELQVIKKIDSKKIFEKLRGSRKLRYADTVDEYIEEIRGR